ncbi:MAG: type II secretion system F family protein [Planctomycetales bacterium]|nr:type II secretion system F family protein [Planctomycetales bacterium]
MTVQTPEKQRLRNEDRQTAPVGVKDACGISSLPSDFANARVKQSDLVLFTTQLSVMLDSGVVLSDAIEAIAEQMHPGTFQQVVLEIAQRLRNGDSFSSALQAWPRIFNTMYVSMVKTSEASGRMAEMLDVLSGYLNADAETRKQVKSAMIYPMVMLLMAVAATGSLMFFVLPRFTRIYQSRGAALPKLTQMLVSCSSLLSNPTFLAFAVTAGVLGFWGWSVWRHTNSGQRVIDWLKVHTPIFGTMITDSIMTRSMRILATMVNTGVSLLEALDVMKMSSGNYYFQALWTHTDAKIRDGYQFSDAIQMSIYSNLIPAGIIQMLRAGEKSGQIGQVCDKVSVFLAKKLQNSIRTATALIEPLMITLMGVIIGTIAIALLLPVFRISSVMSR